MINNRRNQSLHFTRGGMISPVLAGLLIACSIVLLLPVCKGEAQLRSTPQAKSPKEFDAYLVVLSKKTPAEVISAGREFEKAWPHSELLAEVYQLEMNAYRSLNDTSSSIQAGQKALQVAPDNVTVMANLAYILADGTSDKQNLDLAGHYARKALTILKTFHVSKRVSPNKWNGIRRHVESEVHAALGLVAYKNGDNASAIREFESSLRLAPTPNPLQYYRLGLLYQATGQKTKAVGMFQQAAQLNDPTIQRLAQSHLHTLQH